MGVKIRIKNNIVYLDIIQNRKHKWESLGIVLSTDPTQRKEQMKLAEICRAKKENEVLCNKWNLINPIESKKTLIAHATQMAENKSPKHPMRRMIIYLEKFYDGGKVLLSQVDARYILNFQKYLLNETGLSQMTASHYSTALRQVLNDAIRNNYIANNPAETVKNIPIPETRKPTLTVEEIQLLSKTPLGRKETGLKNEVKKAFLFACYTGLRISDISSLKWAEIEQRPVNKYNNCLNWINKKQQKTKDYVEIPLCDTAWTLIQPRQFPDTFVFPLLAKSGTHTDKYIKEWAKNAGIEKPVGWHTARRTFSTLQLENGVDPLTVQRLMGHKKIDTTAIYAKSDRIKSGAVNAIPGITSENDINNSKIGS